MNDPESLLLTNTFISGYNNELIIGCRVKPKLKPKYVPKGTQLVLCELCNCYIQHRIRAKHSKTKKHKINLRELYIFLQHRRNRHYEYLDYQ